MRFPALGETDLLVPLHEGLFEQPMWRTFLARLAAVCGAPFAALVLDGPYAERAIVLSHGAARRCARIAATPPASSMGTSRGTCAP
ncbi:hypothetical protein [Croceibacterium aestuarii]|uniref:hypothetical protein n=1 Tax=Croceibacterium aestuarii TaxID=3064139 RepID=UPI00272DF60A|nr:hypothetical protein [Croceibacterium sp. D39]